MFLCRGGLSLLPPLAGKSVCRLALPHPRLCPHDQPRPSAGRTGSLWEGRYKSSVIQAESYLLTCMRYIELNPVRAVMLKDPGQYRWSS